jgi:YVTN family beta-propeller protein
MTPKLFILTLLLIFPLVEVSAQDSRKDTPAAKTAPTPAQILNAQGVSIEFRVAPLSGQSGVISGEEATLGFKITGTNGGVPLTNLRPVAWIDQRPGKDISDAKQCREKVQAFLQTSFSKRPTIDLNAFFVLTLNQEPNISVIDPLSGFGGSKLFNLIPLASSGEDWVMSANQDRLYVSLPAVNQVAVIDVSRWKPLANIEAGVSPTRTALQNDGRYLWIGNDGTTEADGGVTVIDTSTMKVASQLKTGAGHHEIAFSEDDRFAFVSNQQAGTLSIIDTRKLAIVKTLKVGLQPVAIAFSPLSKAVYVASEEDGTIAVIDSARLEILTRIKAQPGLRALRLQPDGRFGFAVNPAVNAVFVFDLTSNKLVHTVPVGPGADQITFNKQFAYVRSSGSEFVNMIKLADLGKEAALSRFPAGQKAPKESAVQSSADVIVPAPEEGAVLIANPADKMIYYYTEGMAAPMGSFQNYRRVPKALMVLDNGLRETARGVYSTTVRLDAPGFYDAVFLLDSPRALYCFDFSVDPNPAQPRPKTTPLKAQQITNESPVVGETFNLRFKIIDESSGEGKADLNDLGVLVFLAPGIWQQRIPAKPLGGGVYEISFVPPQPGVYYVHFSIPSLDVPFSQIIPLVLESKKK